MILNKRYILFFIFCIGCIGLEAKNEIIAKAPAIDTLKTFYEALSSKDSLNNQSLDNRSFISEEQKIGLAFTALNIFCQVYLGTDALCKAYEGRPMIQCTACNTHKQNIAHVVGSLSATGVAALNKGKPVSKEVESLVAEIQTLKENHTFQTVQTFCLKAAHILDLLCLNCRERGPWIAYTDPAA